MGRNGSEHRFYNLDTAINANVVQSHLFLGHIRQIKRQRVEAPKAPILFAKLLIRSGKAKYTTLKCLLDSGASASMISRQHVKKLKLRNDTTTKWATAAGNVSTGAKCKV